MEKLKPNNCTALQGTGAFCTRREGQGSKRGYRCRTGQEQNKLRKEGFGTKFVSNQPCLTPILTADFIET